MNKLQVIVSTCIPVLLAIVACSAPNGSSGAEGSSPVAAESPAPIQQTGKSLVYFDNNTPGKLPANFHAALTGKGSAGTWEVKADSSAVTTQRACANFYR